MLLKRNWSYREAVMLFALAGLLFGYRGWPALAIEMTTKDGLLAPTRVVLVYGDEQVADDDSGIFRYVVDVNVDYGRKIRRGLRSDVRGFYRGGELVSFDQLAAEDPRVRYNTLLACRVPLEEMVRATMSESPTARLEDCAFSQKAP